MAPGIKKLQRLQFGKEVTPGTPVAATTIWRGKGNQLDDKRKLNLVEENIGILTHTTRTNISELMGGISLASTTATFEQIQHLFAMAFGGPVTGVADTGSGAAATAAFSAGAVTTVTVTSGGTGYGAVPPLVSFTGGGGTGATATAVLTAGVVTSVTVTAGGTGYVSAPTVVFTAQGTGKIYNTTLPTSTIPTARPYTIQGGDNFEQEVMEYCLATKLEFSGGAGGQLMMGGDVIGRQVQQLVAGFTPALTAPTVEDILFQKGKVYLDAIGGAYGTTQVANVILGIKLSMTIKWVPLFTADGILYYSAASFAGYDVKGELMYYHDTAVSGASGAKSFFRNQTKKLLQLNFQGNALATAGSVYTNKALIFNLPIYFDKPSVLGDKDGISTVSMNFDSGYDPTAGNAGSTIVVSEVTALP